MKAYNSTISHQGHIMKHEKVTIETIEADQQELNSIMAQRNDARTTEADQRELYEKSVKLNAKLEADKQWLATNCDLGTMPSNKGKRLIGKAPKDQGSWEITLKD